MIFSSFIGFSLLDFTTKYLTEKNNAVSLISIVVFLLLYVFLSKMYEVKMISQYQKIINNGDDEVSYQEQVDSLLKKVGLWSKILYILGLALILWILVFKIFRIDRLLYTFKESGIIVISMVIILFSIIILLFTFLHMQREKQIKRQILSNEEILLTDSGITDDISEEYEVGEDFDEYSENRIDFGGNETNEPYFTEYNNEDYYVEEDDSLEDADWDAFDDWEEDKNDDDYRYSVEDAEDTNYWDDSEDEYFVEQSNDYDVDSIYENDGEDSYYNESLYDAIDEDFENSYEDSDIVEKESISLNDLFGTSFEKEQNEEPVEEKTEEQFKKPKLDKPLVNNITNRRVTKPVKKVSKEEQPKIQINKQKQTKKVSPVVKKPTVKKPTVQKPVINKSLITKKDTVKSVVNKPKIQKPTVNNTVSKKTSNTINKQKQVGTKLAPPKNAFKSVQGSKSTSKPKINKGVKKAPKIELPKKR